MKTWPNESVGKDAPRGVKNNNPGNIIKTAIKWQGEVPESESTETFFEQYTSMQLGARAHLKNLIYHINQGSDTLEQVIRIWAAGEPEKNLKEYVKFVSNEVGLAPSYRLVKDKTLVNVAWAMSKMEQGFQNIAMPWVSKSVYESAWSLI